MVVFMDEIVKPKRKTHTSSAVKNRYNATHYKVFQVRVKPDLYDSLVAYMDHFGLSRSQFLADALASLSADHDLPY